MKSLVDHITEQEELDERLIRSVAIASYGAQSRKAVEDSAHAFKQGQQALRKGTTDLLVEERLGRMEQALDALFGGLIKQRQQIGAGVAVDVAGHMLAARERRKKGRR